MGWSPLCNAAGRSSENITFLQFTVVLIHSPRAANVSLQTPTPSFHAARWSWKNKGMWDVVLSMVWTIFKIAKLLEYLICFKILIYDFNQFRKRSNSSSSLKKFSLGFGLISQFLFENSVQKYSPITVQMKFVWISDYKEKSMIKMSLYAEYDSIRNSTWCSHTISSYTLSDALAFFWKVESISDV